MPLDAITISALTEELKDKLTGGRIDRVQQPSRDMLLISVRSQGQNLKLLMTCGSGCARVHFTEKNFENPAEAPMLCMLMRKHLVGGRITSVEQPDYERMVVISLTNRDEMGFDSEKKLIVELIGRSSNVILTDSDGRILECMRHMGYGGDSYRRLLPGMIYRYPPKQNKVSFFESSSDERAKMLAGADRTMPVDKWLLSSFSGLAPLICRELSHRCGGTFDTLPEILDTFHETLINREFVPCMIYIDNKPKDFCFMAVSQYGQEAVCRRFDSFSRLLDEFYSQKDILEQQRRRSRELSRTVKNLRDRQQKKLNLQYEELKQTYGRDRIRREAELVTANIYRMKRGDRILECQDYYEDGRPIVKIELDPLKSPQQNAASMFKEYNKLKSAELHLTKLIAEGEQNLDYLNSVVDETDRAESEKDLSLIRAELTNSGFIRTSRKSRREKVTGQPMLEFVSDDGFKILAGRSNSQNDELTTKLARRTDYWLHTQKVHGSHVIIRCEGNEPPERTIMQAAALAAYYSQGRESGKIPVDCTMVRNVRKPSGSLPGKVIYADYKTIFVQADKELTERLKK